MKKVFNYLMEYFHLPIEENFQGNMLPSLHGDKLSFFTIYMKRSIFRRLYGIEYMWHGISVTKLLIIADMYYETYLGRAVPMCSPK